MAVNRIERFDSRRLTGPNLYGSSPGAAIDLRLPADIDGDAFVGRWREALTRGLEWLGWTAELHDRRWPDGRGHGLELMFTAALDRLYAATDLNEWAVARAAGEVERAGELDAIAEAAAREQAERRGLLELVAAAQAHGVAHAVDDDEVSLGLFDQSRRFPLGSEAGLPAPETIDWAGFDRRPVVLITGTNGKTTTTRVLARICTKQGLRVGNTSTDGLYVDEQLVDPGDWTGPGGARAVLRNVDIDIALLEAARGGLLRRGAGVRSCSVSIITNIARDHLGEYGIVDLAGMAAAKGVVATITEPQGAVVLGADSPPLVEWARTARLAAPITWFSIDPDHPVLIDARARGGQIWTVQDGFVLRGEPSRDTRLCPVDALPLSLGGLARHNVLNALAAAAAAHALGIDDDAIIAGLCEFGSRPDDNPGRARLWTIERRPDQPGAPPLRVLLDFAHNLAGIEAMARVVKGLDRAPIVCFGMAGDRSDDDLRKLGAALTSLNPRRVILREQPAYARGREPAEVPVLVEQGLRAVGFEAISHARGEVESLEQALREATAEDSLIVVLVHTERGPVDAWLREHEARPS